MPAHRGGTRRESLEEGIRTSVSTKRVPEHHQRQAAINTPADVKGLKIRTPENLARSKPSRRLGRGDADGVQRAVQRSRPGVVDGQENPLQNIWNGKFYEVQKHLAITGHIYNSAYILISESSGWSVRDLRKAVADSIQEASNFQLDMVANLDKQLLEV